MNNKTIYYILCAILCSLLFACYIVFKDTLNNIISSIFVLLSLCFFITIEAFTLDDFEKTQDLGVNFIAANMFVIFPVLSALFIVFCFILKILFFKTI